MTVRECYEKIGSDFDKVLERMGSEALVKRRRVRIPRRTHLKGRLRQSWAGQIIRSRQRADRKAARTSDRGQRGAVSESGRSVRNHSNRAKGAG